MGISLHAILVSNLGNAFLVLGNVTFRGVKCTFMPIVIRVSKSLPLKGSLCFVGNAHLFKTEQEIHGKLAPCWLSRSKDK